MKTKVEIIENYNYKSKINIGDVGYIDGYIILNENYVRAVVIINDKIELFPLENLKVLNIKAENKIES